MRILFTVQYLGTRYSGWQLQANADSVQAHFEKALAIICKSRIRAFAAGRTDSGVHALGQRVHVDVPVEIDSRGWILGMNVLLPRDIRVIAAEPVAGEFHARYDAIAKRYRYQIWNDSVADAFHAETHAHVPGRLDEKRMAAAARVLIGQHDFRAFTVAAPQVESTLRTITEIDVVRKESSVRILVTADGFLRYMVRRIAGTLIEAGRAKLDSSSVAAMLEPEFLEARWTAPSNGLILDEVLYAGRL